MYSVTLVSTHHSELGKCNSDELYKIIETIKPDVIFEELPQDLFIKFYDENVIPCEPPEVKSVRRYLAAFNVKHFPVDINQSQNLLTKEVENMFYEFLKYRSYSKVEEEQKRLAFEEGYEFLNSKKCEDLFEKKKILEEELISFHLNRDRLSRIHRLFYQEQDNRGHEIIRKIYNYSEKIEYKQGLVLLGAAHRRRVCEKLVDYKYEMPVKLNWNLYGS